VNTEYAAKRYSSSSGTWRRIDPLRRQNPGKSTFWHHVLPAGGAKSQLAGFEPNPPSSRLPSPA
jgi:hypothetical protein